MGVSEGPGGVVPSHPQRYLRDFCHSVRRCARVSWKRPGEDAASIENIINHSHRIFVTAVHDNSSYYEESFRGNGFIPTRRLD